MVIIISSTIFQLHCYGCQLMTQNDPVALLWSKCTLMIEVHCCTSVTDSELGWLRVHLDHGSALQSRHCKEQVYNKGEATHLHSQYTKTKQCLDFRQKSRVHFGVLSWLRSIHIVCLSLLCFLYETSSVAKWKLTSSLWFHSCSNQTPHQLVSMEFNVLDSLNTKMERPVSVVFTIHEQTRAWQNLHQHWIRSNFMIQEQNHAWKYLYQHWIRSNFMIPIIW